MRLDHGEDTLIEVHEINVTPFIDVMLVLLIIFMVAAPLATVDIRVDLPARARSRSRGPDKPLFLTVKPDLTLALGNDPVARDFLRGTLDAATNGDKDARIFLRADKAVPYGELMEVMNLLRAAGYLKVALVGLEKVPRHDRWPAHDLPTCGAGRWQRRHGRARPWRDRRRDGRLARRDRSCRAAAAIVVEFAPVPIAPAAQQTDLRPGPSRRCRTPPPSVPGCSRRASRKKVEQKVEAKVARERRGAGRDQPSRSRRRRCRQRPIRTWRCPRRRRRRCAGAPVQRQEPPCRPR